MTEIEQIDIRSLDYNAKMDRRYTAALLTHLNQIDARVQATKAQVMIWHETLQGRVFGSVVELVHKHYRHYDPKHPDRDALSVSTLGQLVREEDRLKEVKTRRIEPRRGGPPPPHVRKKLDAFYARVGYTPRERS